MSWYHFKTCAYLTLVSASFVIDEFGKSQVDSPAPSSGTAWFFITGESPWFALLDIVDSVDLFENNFIGRQIRDNWYRSPNFSISNWNCFSILSQ